MTMAKSFQKEEVLALLALLRLAKRPVTWSDISTDVRIAGSAKAVLKNWDSQPALIESPEVSEALAKAALELAQWEADGLNLITILSARYPEQLSGVFDCPPILFACGTVIPDDKGMSIVGSRNCSGKGLEMARAAARVLADRGLTIVAGLAEGIDSAAHEEALRVGARTVAVIGTGIRKYYPAKNRQLQDQIAERGLVLSQFYPDHPPTRHTFATRNGTMSGYGLATIVAEASENSGTRIQARKAADHGRPIILSSQVAAATSWGAALADKPWVTVANSQSDLESAIDQILADRNDLLMSELGLATI